MYVCMVLKWHFFEFGNYNHYPSFPSNYFRQHFLITIQSRLSNLNCELVFKFLTACRWAGSTIWNLKTSNFNSRVIKGRGIVSFPREFFYSFAFIRTSSPILNLRTLFRVLATLDRDIQKRRWYNFWSAARFLLLGDLGLNVLPSLFHIHYLPNIFQYL